MSTFPRNVIIICGTHGEILNERFEIPEGIESIYKYNLAAPNTCAFVSGKSYQDTTSSFFLSCKPEDVVSKLNTDDVNKLRISIDEAVELFPDIDSTEETRTINNFFLAVVRLFKERYSLTINESTDAQLQNTLVSQQRGKMHHVCHFGTRGRREMINKEYIICNPQSEHSFELNWTITAVNNNVDLFRATLDYKREEHQSKKARKLHHEQMSVKTSDILEYLESQGVVNVIMFDLTCALIPSPNKDELIALSNSIGYGGKKNQKKQIKPKKTNKSKNQKNKKNKKNKKIRKTLKIRKR
jgi:hypothetical protein